MNETKDIKFIELLRNRNLKATPKRIELLTVIANYGSAMPYGEVQKVLKHYDRVTLYRTINALLDGGIIHKASVSGDDVYYAMCKEYCTAKCHNHKHIHFKCTKCLEVSCMQTSEPIQVQIPKVQIKQIEIEVSGVCEKCL